MLCTMCPLAFLWNHHEGMGGGGSKISPTPTRFGCTLWLKYLHVPFIYIGYSFFNLWDFFILSGRKRMVWAWQTINLVENMSPGRIFRVHCYTIWEKVSKLMAALREHVRKIKFLTDQYFWWLPYNSPCLSVQLCAINQFHTFCRTFFKLPLDVNLFCLFGLNTKARVGSKWRDL